jgi:hypothetical protein
MDATSHERSQRLARDEWIGRRSAHKERVRHWTQDRVTRANLNQKHPIFDFLFTYYSFRPAHLERWSPGADVVLEGCSRKEVDWPDDFRDCDGGVVIPGESFPAHRITYLAWASRYMQGIAQRPASFCCFGLHEWAMVYRSDNPRHEQVPLRVTPREIDSVVENSELRCTHYDAFRFFTPNATPLNKNALSRETTNLHDQRGCIHVTMDLYKFAHKIAPWCSSELIADAFFLALDARIVDMRASPYDLSSFGVEAIPIESSSGRELYVREQRRLSEQAVPIRAQLLHVYEMLGRRLRASTAARCG